MKATLTSKLIQFLLPIFVIPFSIILAFYYVYLMHLSKNETISLSKNMVKQKNNLIEKTYFDDMDFQNYLLVDESLPRVSIMDKNLYIMADTKLERVGETYSFNRDTISLYIKDVLSTKKSDLLHFSEEKFIMKPIVDKEGNIVAFTIGYYKDILEKKQSIIFQTFIFICFIVIFIAFINVILTIIFSYSIVNPIRLLTKQTKKLAQGDYTEEVRISSDNELGVLIDSFNDMMLKQKLSMAVFKNTQEGIMITDADKNIIEVNRAFTLITGYSKSDVIGKNPKVLQSEQNDKEFYSKLWQSIEDYGFWQGNVWNTKKDGTVYPQWLNISTIKDDNKNVLNYIAIFSDITQLKETEKRLDFLAHHDSLTGLPNRLLLNARMKHSISLCKRLGSYAGVCFVDLDNFKIINDTHGHDMGDAVLVEATKRLKLLIREDDTLARVGGDEFVFMFENIVKLDDMSYIAQKIIESLEKPFIIKDKEFFLGASVGISIYPDDGEDQLTLSRHADTAMYVAKKEGRNTYRYYNEDMRPTTL